MADLSEFENLAEEEDLRKQIRELQTKLRTSKAKTADLIGAVHQGARDAAVLLGNQSPIGSPERDRRSKSEEVALLHLSDWQMGKVTKSYSPIVANQRVNALAQKIISLTEIERADHPVHDIHVMLGGDFVEGVSIFPGQAFEVDSSLFEQMFNAVGAIDRLLRTLLENFTRVHVWEEPGNHGRLGRKGDHPEKDSADLLVYRLVKERLNDERLLWNFTQGWHSIVEIGKYRALLVHGDEIRSFGGQTPAFGIAKKVNAWATGVVEPFTDCYMGHWHQPLVIPLAHGRGRVFVNPSLESDNVYAHEFVGASGTPGQRFNFIEPRRGRVTSERIIWLDDA